MASVWHRPGGYVAGLPVEGAIVVEGLAVQVHDLILVVETPVAGAAAARVAALGV